MSTVPTCTRHPATATLSPPALVVDLATTSVAAAERFEAAVRAAGARPAVAPFCAMKYSSALRSAVTWSISMPKIMPAVWR